MDEEHEEARESGFFIGWSLKAITMKKTKESQEIKAYIYIEEKRQRNAMQKTRKK